jgi:hypothetical protein
LEVSAREIMAGFATRTSVDSSEAPSRRYLWTDAFAVCNFLGLYVETKDVEALQLALRLVDEVHRVLGRHRMDDTRQGWISGLDDEEGARHPTIGGLRIGKDLPERSVDEGPDPDLEWDRDGQYFHYLTKWMGALDRVACVTGDLRYRRWAIELARSAHGHFAVFDASGRAIGLHWKMSIDLSRPLVASQGQHDPLDGYLTCRRLQSRGTARADKGLGLEIHQLEELCAGRQWYTEDVLGIGGLLTDAHALSKMMSEGVADEPERLLDLVETSQAGLEAVLRSRQLDARAETRHPFRELGLGIGLRAARRLATRIDAEPSCFSSIDRLRSSLMRLGKCDELASQIEHFWFQPSNRRAAGWDRHREINEVMLATSLAPYGYLEI